MNYTKIITSTALAATLFASCVQQDKKVDYPFIGMSNTTTLDFSKVEINDSSTVLYTNAYYRPHYWIKISSESYLQANGKKYALIGTDGIDADSLFWMPESGEASFVLKFEPMPKGTKVFDFIESDCEECFKLFDIDLTGKSIYNKPDEIPQECLRVDNGSSMPDPIFKVGESTVKIHLLGYRPELGKEINLYVNNMFGSQEPYTIPVDKNGTATLSYLQYGPANAIFLIGKLNGYLWLAPNEQTDVYIDLRKTGYNIMDRRKDGENVTKPEAIQFVYTTGSYSNINNAIQSPSDNTGFREFSMNIYSGQFASYKTSADDYCKLVIEKFNKLSSVINSSDLSPLMKEFHLLSLKQETLAAIAFGDRIRSYNYMYEKKVNRPSAEDIKELNKIEKIKPEHVAEVCKLFDINDTKLIMGANSSDYISAIAFSGFNFAEITGKTEGLVCELPLVAKYPQKAENGELNDKDIEILKSMKNPFYLEAFESIKKKADEKLAAVADKAKIEETPKVSNDKLFDAIIAPHKGKVIVVDFWNTWCGPCRAAMSVIEPMKENELSSDDIVWIYIANETSPIVKYKTMIPEIRGLHYRFNAEQWEYICKKFNIDGIPSYVFVDKDGKYKLSNEFRDHNTMKSTILSAIGKK